MIRGAAGYVVNDYEWALTLERTGRSEREIAAACAAVIITKGEQGSTIRSGDRVIEIPPVRAAQDRRSDGLWRRLSRRPPARARPRSPVGDRRASREPAGRLSGRGRGNAEHALRAAGAARPLRAGVRNAARLMANGSYVRPRKRDLAAIAFAGSLPVPWIALHNFPGLELPSEFVAVAAGLAILGGAFLLSWATELAERDIPQALAILVPRAGERAARIRGRPALRLEGRQGPQLRRLRGRQHDGREPAADRARLGRRGLDRLSPQPQRRARDPHPPAARDALPGVGHALLVPDSHQGHHQPLRRRGAARHLLRSTRTRP